MRRGVVISALDAYMPRSARCRARPLRGRRLAGLHPRYVRAFGGQGHVQRNFTTGQFSHFMLWFDFSPCQGEKMIDKTATPLNFFIDKPPFREE